MVTRTVKPTRKGPRPGTRMRGDLEDAYNARGNRRQDLRHTYSLKRGEDIVVLGELRVFHAILAESDPNIASVDYAPADSDGVDAAVLTREGQLILRTIREAIAPDDRARCDLRNSALEKYRRHGFSSLGEHRTVVHELITEQEVLPGNALLLCNWNRTLKYYAKARHHSLGHAQDILDKYLDLYGRCDVPALIALAEEGAESGLMMAAAIESTAFGRCDSNLSDVVFGRNTVFSAKGRR